MPANFASSCRLLERVVLEGADAAPTEAAREAVLDCLLVLVEASDELKLRNATVVLDILADVVYAEVQGKPVSTKTLLAILRLGETANATFQRLNPPAFTTRRLALPPARSSVLDLKRSA